MRMTSACITLSLALLGWAPAARAELKVGDPAPPFGRNIEWLKGTPVDPARGAGKEIYVVEFWAVWCAPCIVQIPHTTELQKKYAPHRVRFVAMTSPGWQRQRLKDVQRFVREQGSKMAYTIGFDPSETTSDNYMLAAGVNGIPYAFIIARDGRIAWQGHPDGQVERVLDEMVSGTFDLAKATVVARNAKKLKALAAQFNRATAFGQWEDALAALDKMLDVDEADPMGVQYSLQIINNELGDRARVRRWVERYLRDHRTSAAGLTVLARTLMTFPDLGDRHPDLALAAAAGACEADASSVDALQAHAQALHQIGRIDQAIEQQKQALALADGTAKTDAQRTLEFYRACKRLAEP